MTGTANPPAPMAPIEKAIRHGAEAGKLRQFIRQNGSGGLNGLARLAERHSTLATNALKRACSDGEGA